MTGTTCTSTQQETTGNGKENAAGFKSPRKLLRDKHASAKDVLIRTESTRGESPTLTGTTANTDPLAACFSNVANKYSEKNTTAKKQTHLQAIVHKVATNNSSASTAGAVVTFSHYQHQMQQQPRNPSKRSSRKESNYLRIQDSSQPSSTKSNTATSAKKSMIKNSNKSASDSAADEEAQPVSSVMAEYKEKRAAMLRAVLEREERERQDKVANLNLETIPSYSIEQLG